MKRKLMKVVTLFLFFLGFDCPAMAGYPEAFKASVGLSTETSTALELLLKEPGDNLARNPKLQKLLADNAKALELFRQAAFEVNAGYMFAPKNEKPDSSAPIPSFSPHFGLFRLLLINAKISLSWNNRPAAERDLLAAAGLISQLAAQRSAILITRLVEIAFLQRAFPLFSESLRGKPSAAYLEALAVKLDQAAASQDFLKTALLEEAEITKSLAAVTPEKSAEAMGKMTFLRRTALKRVMDEEFYSSVNKMFAAAQDDRTRVYIEAFRENDDDMVTGFLEKQYLEHLARKAKYPAPGFFQSLKDLVFAGKEGKERLVFSVFDSLESVGAPDYSKLIPYYHVYYNWLGVLRTAAAVKRYQRDSKRLPASLEQLIPAHLPAVPRDTFAADKNLRYLKKIEHFHISSLHLKKRERFYIYSLGPDKTDGGGRQQFDCELFLNNRAFKDGDIVFSGY